MNDGTVVGYANLMETITDKNGYFHFANWGPRPTLYGKVRLNAPVLLLFKSGYRFTEFANNGRSGADASPKLKSDWNGRSISMKRFVVFCNTIRREFSQSPGRNFKSGEESQACGNSWIYVLIAYAEGDSRCRGRSRCAPLPGLVAMERCLMRANGEGMMAPLSRTLTLALSLLSAGNVSGYDVEDSPNTFNECCADIAIGE